MKFSIIVPVYNTGKHLEQCIAALCTLDYPRDEYEILMVDNNSTDNSPAILAAATGIRALQEAKQGSYAARNRGLREARGEFLAFTDSDCMPDPGWLRAIEKSFEDPQVQVVLGPRRPAYNQGLVRMLTDYEEQKDRLVYSSSSPELYYGFTNNLGARRSVYDRYGPFIERPRGADTIFVRSVVDGEGCDAVIYNKDVCVEHAEMEGVLAYFQKMFTYGRSWQSYRHVNNARPLRTSERMAAFRNCVRENHYSWYKGVVLLAILMGGLLCWGYGSLMGRWRRPS